MENTETLETTASSRKTLTIVKVENGFTVGDFGSGKTYVFSTFEEVSAFITNAFK